MATNILEAFVKLFADDSQLRASFQGLAPAARLAGITVGDRFAAGVAKAAGQAHEAFKKEFIGPLQTEAAGTGIGRGMQARPQDQYRAADLAAHKAVVTTVRSHGDALAMSGEKAQAWGLSVREATSSARLFGGTIVSAVNPQLGEMSQAALEAIRSLKGLGVTLAGAGAAAAVGAVALIVYIGRVQETIAAKSRLDQAIAARDPAAAASEVVSRTKALEDLISTTKQAAEQSTAAGGLGLFGTGRDAAGIIAAISNIGKSIEDKRKSLAEAQKEVDALTRTQTFPQIEARAAVEANQLLIQKIGLERLSAGTVEQLAASTLRLRDAKNSLVEAAIKELDVTERLKQQNIFDAAAKREAPVAQDVQDKIMGDITRRQNNIRAAARAVDVEDARQSTRDIIALEEREMAHSVEMGRVSMAAQLEASRAAMSDPRRTIQEQQDAEAKAFQLRRSMAEEYFKFQGNLGRSTWQEQLAVAKGFLSEISQAGGAGSKPWFDQTSKIFELYKGMRDQAQGVLSSMVGIVAAETSRADAEQQRAEAKKASDADEASRVERMARSREADALTRRKADQADSEIEARPTRKKMTAQERSAEVDAARTRIRERREAAQAKEEEVSRDEAARQRQKMEAEASAKQREEVGKVSLRDFPSILRDARQRDANALRGDRVPVGDIGGAVGRVDFWRTVDKEKLSPDVAVARLMEDPSAKLARALEGLTGGAGDVTPVLTGLGEAAAMATRALLALAGAGPENGGSQASPARRPRRGPPLSEENGGSQSDLADRPRGGPQMSEENRQAILDTVSTQLTDENLAVYGRR